jgi:hypothetical protein
VRSGNILKPQDVLVLLKLLLWEEAQPWSFHKLASALGMSTSEVHSAIRRTEVSGLYDPLTRRPKRSALKEFLLYGLPYVYPGVPERGKHARGIPTAHSALPLSKEIVSSPEDRWVWPSGNGKVKGTPLAPLYRSVPKAIANDPRLHELLALIDALRSGRTRERELAKGHIEKRLSAL